MAQVGTTTSAVFHEPCAHTDAVPTRDEAGTRKGTYSLVFRESQVRLSLS